MYALDFTPMARKQFAKLPKELQQRITAALDRVLIRPHAFVEHLVNSPYYKLRVGKYRVILDVRGTELLILVIEPGPRESIYK